MPSDSMNIQEQGFRSRMFGGFDKNDVLAYMNTLANEAQQHELEYQEKLRQLQAQLDDLRSQRSDAEARIEAMKADGTMTTLSMKERWLLAMITGPVVGT